MSINSKIQASINKMEQKSLRCQRIEKRLKYLDYISKFGDKEDDIYIVTYPRSGTTLMQMILYQLVTDGNLNIESIFDVTSWLRADFERGIPVQQLPSPRIIKTHDMPNLIDSSTKGRFIYIQRDVKDCMISNYYHENNYDKTNLEFFMNWITKYNYEISEIKGFVPPQFELEKEFGLERYINLFLSKKYNWYLFSIEWLENRKKLPVLYLRYEDLINHFDECLTKIINFLELDPAKVDRQRVYDCTRFDFMKQHESIFVPILSSTKFQDFIRKGKIGEGKETIPEKYALAMDEAYEKYVKPLEKNKFAL